MPSFLEREAVLLKRQAKAAKACWTKVGDGHVACNITLIKPDHVIGNQDW